MHQRLLGGSDSGQNLLRWPRIHCRPLQLDPARAEYVLFHSFDHTQEHERTVHISDYAWADDGLHVKVYLSVPGVRREAVQCEFRDDAVDFAAEGLPDGTRRVLALRRLYDHIHPPGCSCKVLESKGKVVLALAKPPRSTTFDAVKDWRTLTLACGAERIDVADPFASHQQKSFDGMMAGLPPLPAKSAARPH